MLPNYLNEHDTPTLSYSHAAKDVRHLLKGDFTELPEISNYQMKQLYVLLENLNYSLPDGSYDLTLARLKAVAWDEFFQSKAGNPEQYQKAFAEYRRKLNDIFTDFEIVYNPFGVFEDIIGKKYDDFMELYNDIKVLFTGDEFMDLRMYIIEDLIRYVPRQEQSDIYSDEFFINQIFPNINISVNDSVAKFYNYKSKATKQAKRLENEQKARQKSKKKS